MKNKDLKKIALAFMLCIVGAGAGVATANAASISDVTTALGWTSKEAYAGTVATARGSIATSLAVSVDDFIKWNQPATQVYSTYQDVYLSYSSVSGTHTYQAHSRHEVDGTATNNYSPAESY